MTFDIKAFEDFCRSKPAGATYDAGDDLVCALAQFGKPGLSISNCDQRGVPKRVYAAAVHGRFVGDCGPYTWGALADRLAKLREEQSA